MNGSERQSLPLHQKLAQIRSGLHLGILNQFFPFKPIRFNAGSANIEFAIKIFYQAFHELCYGEKLFCHVMDLRILYAQGELPRSSIKKKSIFASKAAMFKAS